MYDWIEVVFRPLFLLKLWFSFISFYFATLLCKVVETLCHHPLPPKNILLLQCTSEEKNFPRTKDSFPLKIVVIEIHTSLITRGEVWVMLSLIKVTTCMFSYSFSSHLVTVCSSVACYQSARSRRSRSKFKNFHFILTVKQKWWGI